MKHASTRVHLHTHMYQKFISKIFFDNGQHTSISNGSSTFKIISEMYQKTIKITASKTKKKITVHHPTTYLHVYKIVNYSPGIVTKHCSRDEIYVLIQTQISTLIHIPIDVYKSKTHPLAIYYVFPLMYFLQINKKWHFTIKTNYKKSTKTLISATSKIKKYQNIPNLNL